jgi:hypothetical protein
MGLKGGVFACLLLLLLLALGCGSGGSAQEEPAETPGIVVRFPSPAGEITPRPRRTPVPTVTPAPEPLKVCAPNPDPAPPALLQIVEPKPEQRVKSPVHVIGWGSNIGLQDKGVALAVVNAKQEVLQVLYLPPQPRTYRVAPPGLEITEHTKPFGADVVLPNVREPTPVCLWAYLETTETGSPRGVAQVPILVEP